MTTTTADEIFLRRYLDAIRDVIDAGCVDDGAILALLKAVEFRRITAPDSRYIHLTPEQRGALRELAADAIRARGGEFPVDKREKWVADAKGLRKEMR